MKNPRTRSQLRIIVVVIPTIPKIKPLPIIAIRINR
jgi:hypothetical protein